LNAENRTMDLVIDERKVHLSGTLSDTTELVINGTVAKADPTLVGTKVRYGNATQVSANGRGAHDGRVTGIRDHSRGLLIQLGGLGESIGLLDLRLGQTTDEDHLTVPGSLENFTRRQLSNVQFLVGVSDVSVSSDHLLVEASDEGLDTQHVGGDDETLEHIHLGSLDLVVLVLLVPQSVLIEPVVGLGLGVNGITEVAGTARGNPEVWAVGDEQVVCQLLVLSVIVVLQDAEVLLAYNAFKQIEGITIMNPGGGPNEIIRLVTELILITYWQQEVTCSAGF